ncbi:MAG: hypothetical protein DRQ54_08340 [Gammaproteobacteria bacterium]|nr:MAG: hypothetical protein DRQ54_08340 [Gammaproteobacteria bacterium]RLA16006.1 MAG: hypothetical protein DRQ52_00375 [Gammaproteobacteria bacterium]
MKFELHQNATAPESSRPILEATEQALKFVPNLYRVMAESPAALTADQAMGQAQLLSALSAVEQQVVAITISIANGCEYCAAAHSTLATDTPLDDAFTKQAWQPLKTNYPVAATYHY